MAKRQSAKPAAKPGAKSGAPKRASPRAAKAPKKGAGGPGALLRLPLAALFAGVAGAGLSWWVAGRPEGAALTSLAPLILRQGLSAAALFGTIGAFVLGRGALGGLAGAVLGLTAAGLALPLALAPENWPLGAVALGLGLSQEAPARAAWVRPLAAALVLGVTALALGTKGLVWAGLALAGLLGALLPLPWAGLIRPLGVLMGLGSLAGAALTVKAGFVEVQQRADRAVLAEWADLFNRDEAAWSEIIPARSRSRIWTAGRPIRYRLRLDGPTFRGLPPVDPGLTLATRSPDARDLAELGMEVNCEALMPKAVEGERRARALATKAACSGSLDSLAASDPVIDAARVLRGKTAMSPGQIAGTTVELPLDEAGAMLLAAAARLDAPKAAAQALVDGSDYDRALLMPMLGKAERRAAHKLILAWAEEVPAEVGGVYQRALMALEAEGL
ncbi:MAG: hypothetical protein IPI35_10585 [Deltaproteobacteria bacterium]|nr:hypothetical protein [Deltaproteobacteria bacterium]